jgi:D-glycero-alpha-D-manno-heptose-7-phosphate kinase
VSLRVISATAPIRICDLGGWTDTWVARHGHVFNIAVQPNVFVRIDAFPRDSRPNRITIAAENYGLRYSPALDGDWGPHPLLEAAIRAHQPPDEVAIEVTIQSAAPPAASTGTSAAVLVALLAALDRLNGGHRTAHEMAMEAHRVETEELGQLSGVQDQLCSAYGGVNFIDVVEYPRALVTRLDLSDEVTKELDRRLVLVYLGRPHSSSPIHARVMRDLEQRGADCATLVALRRAATRGRDAAASADFVGLGRAMTENTLAQAELDADLVHRDAWRVSEIATAHGALGWKVNGAGGDGGSIAILCGPDPTSKHAMVTAICEDNPALQWIPVTISRAGVHVREN